MLTSLRPRTPRRGQSLVEFAIAVPVLLILFFGVVMFWGNFQRDQSYSRAAETLAEWIGREGVYTAPMRDWMRSQLDDAAGVSADSSFLYISVTAPDGSSVTTIGEPMPTDVSGPGDAPGNTGWDSVSTITNLEPGSQVRVLIWGIHFINIPLLPLSGYSTPHGQSVFMTIAEPGS